MKKFFIHYCFFLVCTMTVTSFLFSQSFAQVISSTIFFPLFIYFLPFVIPKPRLKKLNSVTKSTASKKLVTKTKAELSTQIDDDPAETGQVLPEGFDLDRRVLLKLIGSAGIGLFMMSLFTKKSHAAFFGSTPGQGTVGLKDSNGTLIDPAIKTPTDGYKISEVDDSSSPAYYGFVDKTGAWFIMKEDSSGAYRYTKGNSSFSTNWSNRAILSYDYFDSIF